MAEQSPLRGEEVKLTDFEYLVLDITHIITCLYRFSIAIQNPAPKERLHKIALIDVSHFKDWDVQHIIEMFHPADPHNNFRVDGFLSERLGKANTRRRQLLGYYKSHHEKISKHIDDPPSSASVIEGTELPTVMVPTGEGAPAPQMLPNPERAATVCTMAMSQTTVPTIKPEPKKGDEAEWKLPQTPYAKLRQAVEVEQNDDQLSQTSYATTINHKMRIRVPSPPDEIAAFDGEPFECPYCFTITEIRDRQDWKYVGNYTCNFYMLNIALGSMYLRIFNPMSVHSEIAPMQINYIAANTSGMIMRYSSTGENGTVMTAQHLFHKRHYSKST